MDPAERALAESIGQEIKDARLRYRVTAQELAERLGVSRQTVSMWETGRNLPGAYDLARIAAMFRVTFSAFVGAGPEGQALPRSEVTEMIKCAVDPLLRRISALEAAMAGLTDTAYVR